MPRRKFTVGVDIDGTLTDLEKFFSVKAGNGDLFFTPTRTKNIKLCYLLYALFAPVDKRTRKAFGELAKSQKVIFVTSRKFAGDKGINGVISRSLLFFWLWRHKMRCPVCICDDKLAACKHLDFLIDDNPYVCEAVRNYAPRTEILPLRKSYHQDAAFQDFKAAVDYILKRK